MVDVKGNLMSPCREKTENFVININVLREKMARIIVTCGMWKVHTKDIVPINFGGVRSSEVTRDNVLKIL